MTPACALDAMSEPIRLHVAVLIEEQRQPNAWEAWRFRIEDVVPDEGQFGSAPRVLRDDGRNLLRLHPGLEVALHRDEAEGYYLNLSSGAPVWFVMWRVDDADPSRAWPELVTLSYDVAGRLLEAQERVDNVPLRGERSRGCRPTPTRTTSPSPRSATAGVVSCAGRAATERADAGFLSRWSRRKVQAREGVVLEESAPVLPRRAAPPTPVAPAVAVGGHADAAGRRAARSHQAAATDPGGRGGIDARVRLQPLRRARRRR